MALRLIAAGLVCAHLAGCTVETETRVVGVGVTVSRMQVLGPDLREIRVEDGLALVLLPQTGSEEPHAVLEGHENLLRYVRLEQGAGTLRVSVDRGFALDPAPRVKVVAGTVDTVRGAGAGAVEVVDLAAEDFAFHLTGSETLRATGRVARLELNAVGSGAIDLSELLATRVVVETIGSGRIRLHATGEAQVRAIGSGLVTVSGGATIEKTVVGSGGVETAAR